MYATACGDPVEGTGDDETAGSETATETGDGDGDPTAEGQEAEAEGDGDGDPTTGDGDGDGDGDPCPIGSEGCPCTVGGGCDPGLVCDLGVCGPGDPTGDGDGDGDPTTGDGDGDGDPTTGDGDGDGDGDPGGACQGDQFIEIEAEAADEAMGWSETMSMLGEDLVMSLDMGAGEGSYLTWNLDIPCDDTWHIWIRAIDAQQQDSFFAQVDGEPDPEAIYEVGCDGGPQQAEYVWTELNWRDQNDPACTYLQDPWTFDWTAGVHTLTLSYRESYAVSRLWLTNTTQTPP